jgi:predicted aldo/keto reductase-like oxidoreductase
MCARYNSASSAQAEHNSISPAVWAFRWLWNQKEVAVVLSGMNENSQLEENINAANSSVPAMLTEEENAAYETVIKIFNASYKILQATTFRSRGENLMA